MPCIISPCQSSDVSRMRAGVYESSSPTFSPQYGTTMSVSESSRIVRRLSIHDHLRRHPTNMLRGAGAVKPHPDRYSDVVTEGYAIASAVLRVVSSGQCAAAG